VSCDAARLYLGGTDEIVWLDASGAVRGRGPTYGPDRTAARPMNGFDEDRRRENIVQWVGWLVLIPALLLSGCTAADPTPEAHAPSPLASRATGCASQAQTGPLPTWARAGFSGDGAGVPHVFGRQGDILGVLFGGTLSSPPAPDRSNKILWVSRVPVTPGGSLEITATLDGTTETVRRTVTGGPGPSGIDMPKPGCWHFALTWSDHTDAMDLAYEPGP